MKKVESFFKNIILNLLLLQKPASRKSGIDNYKPSKILFIRLNRIGDALVTTPLFDILHKKLDSKIYLLADRKNYFVFDNNPSIDKVLIFNKGIKGFLEVLKFIKDEDIDTIVDMHDDVSTTVSYIVALAKCPNKYGLEKVNKKIYTRTIPRPNPVEYHVIERIIQVTKLFSIEPEISDVNIHFYPDENSLASVQNFLDKNITQNKFLIGINISAGSDARFWGVEKFKELLDYLNNFNCNILILSAPNDVQLAEKISENKYPVFSSKNYSEFGAMISKLNLLITPDTAAVHLASAYKVPVFGIYVQYNTNDMIWSPYKSDFEYVLTKEPTLKNISFEEVKNKLDLFLRKYI